MGKETEAPGLIEQLKDAIRPSGQGLNQISPPAEDDPDPVPWARRFVEAGLAEAGA
jgi:hypothetical protein